MTTGIQITHVVVRLQEHPDPVERFLLAHASVTFNGVFKVHDFQVILNRFQKVVVMFPSRRLMDVCEGEACGHKNHLKARFCNECGRELPPNRGLPGNRGEIRYYADVCHPTNDEFRQIVCSAILKQYEVEKEFVDNKAKAAKKVGEKA